MKQHTPQRLPQLLLERLALGELSPQEAEAVRERLAREEGGQERLSALEAGNDQLLSAHPPAQMAHRIKSQAALTRQVASSSKRSGWFLLAGPALGALAAAALLWVWGPGVQEASNPDVFPHAGGDVIRLKGAPLLFVHRKSEDGSRPLRDLDVAAQGDLLQVSFNAATWSHGMILSVDGRGAVTLHYPSAENASSELVQTPGQQEVMLDHAYELDDAPSFEFFMMITSQDALPVSDIVQHVRDRAQSPALRSQIGESELKACQALALDEILEEKTFTQTQFLVRKQP